MGAEHGNTGLRLEAYHRWLRMAHVAFWIVAAIGMFFFVHHLSGAHAHARGGGSDAARRRAKPQLAGEIVATIPLPNGAFDLAAGDGSIWAATNSSVNPGAPGSETDVARIAGQLEAMALGNRLTPL